MTIVSAPRPTAWVRLGRLARRALLMEIRGYQNTYRFLLRRPRVPAGALGFSHHRPVLPLLIVFVVVSAVELVVVDLIVHRWAPGIRVPLLVVGVWGLVWMLGLLFGMLTRPHAVGPDGIQVRDGSEVNLALGWDVIASVARRRIVVQDRQPKLTVDPDGRTTLHLRVQNETNLQIVLDRPVSVRLPSGPAALDAVHLYADDPRGFLDEVRRRIG